MTRFTTDLKTLKKEVTIETYKSSGPGGQRKNVRETAVRLNHLPSGITVSATEYRFQAKNRRLAFERLQAKLEELNRSSKPRIPTKVPKSVDERRLKDKGYQSQKKKLRKKPLIDRD